ncbi:hypothetical protein Micbo1qcDRAFT_232171 [Microdochium bolleyi]|uniref:Uncharacterized protein n=1 Tax=Microdochium bolleyi TaxID=196109 RepID=A0A136JC92_9PEZI|nr:hypothetical protein Micbo1qcDRAFT_232171 [Microdochium bolleyi]
MAQPDHPEDTQAALVPVPSRPNFLLLEAVALTKVLLNSATTPSHDLDSADREASSPLTSPIPATAELEDPDELFRAFVYKLAHVCDNIKGDHGMTITSFTILRSERPETRDTIAHYWFASNRRTRPQLDETRAYVVALLRKVQLVKGTVNAYRSNILRDIIHFNQDRLTWYLGELKRCIEQCHNQENNLFESESNLVRLGLGRIRESIEFPKYSIVSEDNNSGFVYGYERLMRRLTQLENSKAGQLIAQHVRGLPQLDRPSDKCWHDFQHAMSRILAYPKSLQCILKARDMWPALFANFQVFYVDSSRPLVGKTWREKSLTAAGIVGRMTRRQSDIVRNREYVEQLQLFDLDRRIEEEFTKSGFRPIVHSEVLLLNFLEFTGEGISADRFFEGGRARMYIGTSKPLCRLCKYYFEEHSSSVGHRPTHNNLYMSWRLPDVLKSQGQPPKDAREKMLERMLKRVRADGLKLIKDKIPASVKQNDSNTFSANFSLRDDFSTLAGDDIDDIISMLGGATLQDDASGDDGDNYHYTSTESGLGGYNFGERKAVSQGANPSSLLPRSFVLSQSSLTSGN